MNETNHIREKITQLNSTAKMYMPLFYIKDHCRFLMTDNPDLKASLSTKYAYFITYNSIVAHSGSVSIQKPSPKVIDSLVEMYLLSQCSLIIKSSG